jgi:hypothetical protein
MPWSQKQIPHPAESAGIRDDTLWWRFVTCDAVAHSQRVVIGGNASLDIHSKAAGRRQFQDGKLRDG